MRRNSISLTSTSILEHHLVIETQSQLRHAGEIAFHLDRAQNLASDDGSRSVDLVESGEVRTPLSINERARHAHQKIDALHNVQENFVLPIPDSL